MAYTLTLYLENGKQELELDRSLYTCALLAMNLSKELNISVDVQDGYTGEVMVIYRKGEKDYDATGIINM